jgi:isopentenyl diphosphate isomerase/L-lactate dehydrogenase-like FMN-dependent dehydrogenase
MSLSLNKISDTDTTTSVLGLGTSLPIYIAPAALARLGHPDGEMNLTRAAGNAGILQGVSRLVDNVYTREATELFTDLKQRELLRRGNHVSQAPRARSHLPGAAMHLRRISPVGSAWLTYT